MFLASRIRTGKFEGCRLLNRCKLCRYISGVVEILEVPSYVHATVGSSFARELIGTVEAHVSFEDGLTSATSPTTHNAAGEAREPDYTFSAFHRPADPNGGCDGRGNPWPNLIVETAYAQPRAQVESKILQYWLPAGVKIAVLFQVGHQEYQGNLGTLRSHQVSVYYHAQYRLPGMEYDWFSDDGICVGNGVHKPDGVTYCRSGPMEFGFVLNNGTFVDPAPGVGVYTITLPSAPLFYGQVGGPVLPESFVIDLWRITYSLREVK